MKRAGRRASTIVNWLALHFELFELTKSSDSRVRVVLGGTLKDTSKDLSKT